MGGAEEEAIVLGFVRVMSWDFVGCFWVVRVLVVLMLDQKSVQKDSVWPMSFIYFFIKK
jgi:hypothetical protein